MIGLASRGSFFWPLEVTDGSRLFKLVQVTFVAGELPDPVVIDADACTDLPEWTGPDGIVTDSDGGGPVLLDAPDPPHPARIRLSAISGEADRIWPTPSEARNV